MITISQNKIFNSQQYFVSSSYMFLDKKTVLEIWLNLGFNLTIFRETRPWTLTQRPIRKWTHLWAEINPRLMLSFLWTTARCLIVFTGNCWLTLHLSSHFLGTLRQNASKMSFKLPIFLRLFLYPFYWQLSYWFQSFNSQWFHNVSFLNTKCKGLWKLAVCLSGCSFLSSSQRTRF